MARPRGPTPILKPVVEHDHSEFRSITGGFVYRGQALPALRGWYLCADYVTQNVWAIRRAPPDPDGRPVVERALLLRGAGVISSFAQGHDGELLLVDHMGNGPSLARLVPAKADAAR